PSDADDLPNYDAEGADDRAPGDLDGYQDDDQDEEEAAYRPQRPLPGRQRRPRRVAPEVDESDEQPVRLARLRSGRYTRPLYLLQRNPTNAHSPRSGRRGLTAVRRLPGLGPRS